MNLEGGYGVFIYTLVPIAFVVVLGSKALGDATLADPKTIFVTFAGKVFPGAAGEGLNWIIAFMLIVALALSALNAIMGSGRALYQMAMDGEFPKWFAKQNEHGVPGRAMAFNVVASLIVVLAGGAVEIYSFSNVGYTVSFIPVLIGYFLLRQDKPDMRRPFKLPEFMKYVALIVAAIYFVFWLLGGLWYSKLGNVEVYYWAGWVTLFAYLPLYWYRVYVEDKRV
jgi:amino acid transporter